MAAFQLKIGSSYYTRKGQLVKILTFTDRTVLGSGDEIVRLYQAENDTRQWLGDGTIYGDTLASNDHDLVKEQLGIAVDRFYKAGNGDVVAICGTVAEASLAHKAGYRFFDQNGRLYTDLGIASTWVKSVNLIDEIDVDALLPAEHSEITQKISQLEVTKDRVFSDHLFHKRSGVKTGRRVVGFVYTAAAVGAGVAIGRYAA